MHSILDAFRQSPLARTRQGREMLAGAERLEEMEAVDRVALAARAQAISKGDPRGPELQKELHAAREVLTVRERELAVAKSEVHSLEAELAALTGSNEREMRAIRATMWRTAPGVLRDFVRDAESMWQSERNEPVRTKAKRVVGGREGEAQRLTHSQARSKEARLRYLLSAGELAREFAMLPTEVEIRDAIDAFWAKLPALKFERV